MLPLPARKQTGDCRADLPVRRIVEGLIKTLFFTLAAYWKSGKPGDPPNLYIEGDGAVWLSLTRLSGNATPREPFDLTGAGMDPAANVAYPEQSPRLRPCEMQSLRP